MRLTVCIALIATLALVALATQSAIAYPQYQLSMGADRCIACHYSPAGGGLLNDYGRDEAGSSIARDGDGRFLHGLWTPPQWLQLGADLRGASAVKYRGKDRELLAFPMQVDMYVRAGGEKFSFTLTAGLRGGARDPQPALAERVVSREHYFMYQADSGAYVRVGRFFPIYGVRSQDHSAYVRRFMGMHTLEEPYGASVGWFGESSEAHISAFVPRPIEFLGSGVKARGVALYYERRLMEDKVVLAPQAKVAVSSDDVRVTAGLVAKRWMPDAGLMMIGEVNLQRQSFSNGAGPTRYQLSSYLGASRFVTQGLMIGAGLHRWQPDLRLRSSRDAAEINVQYFPNAHLELHLLTRVSGEGDVENPGVLSLLQLHYFL
jgi:hypothetical protein